MIPSQNAQVNKVSPDIEEKSVKCWEIHVSLPSPFLLIL
jgi:hypothetical protein